MIGNVRQALPEGRTSDIKSPSTALAQPVGDELSYSRYANPTKKTPSVPLMAYNLAVSKEGVLAAALEDDDDESLDPAGPLKTSVLSAELALELELAVAEAVAVELVLGGLGSWAPQGWSCLQALAQRLSEPQSFSHWLPHSVQTK